MAAAKQVWLTTLVHHVVEQWQIDGYPELVPGCRELLVNRLEHILVDPVALHRYIKTLYQLLEGDHPYIYELPSERLDAVMRGGLRKLTDEELAQLLLNHTALLGIAFAVERTQPSYWLMLTEHIRAKGEHPQEESPISKG